MRGARLARLVWKDPAFADRLEKEAADLKRRFNRDFWVEDGAVLRARPGGGRQQVDALASNNGHLLWSGIVDKSKAKAVARHLMSPAMYSGWGVRTLAEGQGRYNPIGYHVGTIWPFDNSFIAWGLRRYGFKEEAARIAAGILDAAEFFDGRLPEAFGGYPRELTKYPVQYPTACSPQAWSTGAPLLLLRTMLGLEPTGDHLIVDPALPQGIGRLELLDIPGRWGRMDAFGRGRVDVEKRPRGALQLGVIKPEKKKPQLTQQAIERRDRHHEGHHRWRSRGRRVVRRAPAQAGRERRDPHGGARAVRLVRELRPAVLHRRRDRAAVEPPGRDARTPFATCSPSTPARTARWSASRRGEKTVQLKDRATGEVTTEHYDKLVLSPGAAPIRPPLPGIDLPGIFGGADGAGRRPDPRVDRRASRQIVAAWTPTPGSRRAGRHAARRRRRRRLHRHRDGREPGRPRLRGHAAAARRPDHGAARPRDGALRRAAPGQARRAGPAERRGVRVRAGGGRVARGPHRSGQVYPADIVILGIGVRPETALAEMAGIEVGELGGIRVDDQMRTSDPDIFAVGDAVEKKDCMTGEWSLVALAGPANRQGRIAADVIAGRDSRFRGTQGTAILGAFGGAVAWTGVSEKTLKRLGDDDYEKVYLYPNSHAGYYPGATLLAMKVIFRKSDGRLLGAQAVGREGVDKRIDALAMAIQLGGTVYDLEECELCYAPQFGIAKSPANFAGMVGGRRACAATCRSSTGTPWTTASCSTCAIPRSSPSSSCRAWSTSRWTSSAGVWTSCRATARSSSSAARASAPTTRRGSSCRTASRARTVAGGMLSHEIFATL